MAVAALPAAMYLAKNAFSILDMIYQAAKEISNYVKRSKINMAQEEELLKQIGILQSLLQNLRTQLDARKEEPTEAMIQGLENLHQQMKKCKDYCKPATHKSLLEVSIDVIEKKDPSKRIEIVKSLKEELSAAIQMIQLILQVESTEREIKKGNEEITTCQIINAATGIGCYPVPSGLYGKLPGKILNVQTKTNGDRMVLTWDYDGHNNSVKEYEIHISQEGKSLPATRSIEKSVILCRPIIIPGKRYAFQIRPIGKSGNPGDFSEEIKVRFLTAAPATPLTPCATACNINEIEISVKYPSEEECNGSPATHCIVELFNTDDDNCNRWIRHPYILHKNAYAPRVFKERVSDLEKYCTYEIRVYFANDAGESLPSKSTTCTTLEPVPGPPTQFRFSSYRTANMIKLRWNRPDIHPRFVHHYKIEFSKSTVFGDREWKPAGETHRLSFRVKDLPQDTRYYFRVRSVTENHQESVWTHEIDETTRFSKLSKAALTPLALVGGTVGAPVVGAVGGTALSVENEKEVSAKSVAKGIAGGVGWTIGCTLLAPVVGIAAAHTLITEGNKYSDQSDDDD